MKKRIENELDIDFSKKRKISNEFEAQVWKKVENQKNHETVDRRLNEIRIVDKDFECPTCYWQNPCSPTVPPPTRDEVQYFVRSSFLRSISMNFSCI